jgi:colicin import membrane protein
MVAAPTAPKPVEEPVARQEAAPKAAVAKDRSDQVPATQPVGAAMPAAGAGPTRFTVLVVLEPGTYGIRRNGPKVADPVLCTHEGCYVSGGADRPATYMPGHKALGIGNTWGGRAGACRQALGCVFRSIELGQLPGFLQPVDLHIFKHDRRQGHLVLADSNCRADAGHLSCRHGIYADNYTMWVIPESLAATVGPAALQRAVTEGLNGPRSAELMPMQR